LNTDAPRRAALVRKPERSECAPKSAALSPTSVAYAFTRSHTGLFFFGPGLSLVIDCVGVYTAGSGTGIQFTGANQVIKIRNLTFSGSGGSFPAIQVTGSGTLILENCVFENMSGTALDIEPTGALNLVITNSRMSNSGSGVLIKPASGGSVTATFDGVTIADNTGGGVKTDSTNGAINLAISNSTITKNNGNGLNAVGGAFGASDILELVHDVIASNGTAGVQANGTTAAVLVNNTSILNNATGATSIVAGGRILTYGNNSIVGTSGSGFTSTTPLQ
jgi:Right handed beta helix region